MNECIICSPIERLSRTNVTRGCQVLTLVAGPEADGRCKEALLFCNELKTLHAHVCAFTYLGLNHYADKLVTNPGVQRFCLNSWTYSVKYGEELYNTTPMQECHVNRTRHNLFLSSARPR